MSGAGFILAINLAVAGLLATAFLFIQTHDRRDRAAGWFALGYVFAMANLALEFVLAAGRDEAVVRVAIFAAFLAAQAVMIVGLAERYANRVPWRLIASLFVACVALNLVIVGLPRADFLRQLLYQAPYALMQIVAASIVWRSPARRGLDTLLAALLAAFGLQFLLKPWIAIVSGGVGDTADSYITTLYAMISQALGTVFAMATALLMLVILLRDLLADAAHQSSTDSLSGLLNRRGLEEQARLALRQAQASNAHISLVLCDLDRFKTINDTHGHAAGDAVIAAFAECLGEQTRENQFAGRIGGEEFAILLPRTTLQEAWQFAERVRASFSARTISGLPAEAVPTASFGVAERQGTESYSALLSRADRALYQAKAEGRDRVRAASELERPKAATFSVQPGQ
jgi:diguanylate cyclase (GGDEF)-like protein